MTPSEISSSYIGNPGIENPMFPSQASAMEARDRLIEQGIEDKTEKVCIFKPKVQILDNWGWCNGVGFSPYMSCVFMVKEKAHLYDSNDPERWPFFYTMENSRPADGPLSAFIALKTLGVRGFQRLIAHLSEVTTDRVVGKRL